MSSRKPLALLLPPLLFGASSSFIYFSVFADVHPPCTFPCSGSCMWSHFCPSSCPLDPYIFISSSCFLAFARENRFRCSTAALRSWAAYCVSHRFLSAVGKPKQLPPYFLSDKSISIKRVINRVWNPLGISFGCEETKWIAAFVILCFRACVPIFDEAFFCPCFLSLQMHHPIQMKPADSEKSNGEWHCTHAQRQTHQYHIHTYTCMHASIAFFEFCLVMAISAWLADSAGDSGKRLKHRAEERKGVGWGNTDIYKYIFLCVMNY